MAGWANQPLGEVCELIRRGISPTYLESGGVAVLNQKCVREHAVNFDLGRRHDVAAKKVTSDRFIRAGDVLVNSTGTGTLGRVAQLRHDPPEPTTVDSHVTIVRPMKGLFYPEFFGYALVSIEEQIQAGGEGCGGQTELARTKLAEGYRISFPRNLREQRRIVAVLDEAFEAIATAEANTEKNKKNARLVLDLARQKKFQALAEDHRIIALGNCCTFENGDRGKNYPGKQHRVVEGVPFINAGHLTEAGINFAEMDYISPERFALLGNGKIRPDDILFCLRGSLGKFACVDDLAQGAIASSLVILRPSKLLTKEYLLEFLASSECAKQIGRYKGGAAQPNLGAKDLKQFELPLPPADVQLAMTAHLAAVRDAVRETEALLCRKLTVLGELKKSLIHQAFTGQLSASTTDKLLAEAA
jgi:type I restriction enzyme, S subunit